ncbi:hypothetical protein RHGRI_029558 [Rhododendron griersonianum]|uniref:PNPLA domain-containing protein n=1 Tax=Rhododendron griersonianum TaxID=479676 RepID=A0AAV6IJX1_9ERIC|nr:hypothetical protein RHGRI_029558 [Rhododendron griersonianum]
MFNGGKMACHRSLDHQLAKIVVSPANTGKEGQFLDHNGIGACGKEHVSKNALLSDICIGTSAAPTYFPAHYFDTKDKDGNTRTFNLIDGGVAANNPKLTNQPMVTCDLQTLLAMTHISKQIFMGRFKFNNVKPMETDRMLVLSLGTGTAKQEEKYNAAIASKWGQLNWVMDNGATPLLDVYGHASADMVDIHISTLFQSLRCEHNYLRIQDDTLTGDASSVDVATEENLKRLVQIGEELLEKPVSRVDLDTGRFVAFKNGGTNAEALNYFAQMLSDEKRLRERED